MTSLARWMTVFGLLYFVPTARGARCGNNDHVGSDDPNRARHESDSGNGVQYVATGSSYTLGCCGVVDSWTIYVKSTGTVDLQIWRETSSGTYQLVGTSQFTYTSDSYETTETLTSATYILVLTGDYIGWYASGSQMIPYRWNGWNQNSGVFQTTNSLVTVGNTISTPSSSYSGKDFAIQAHLAAGNSPSFSNLGVTVTVPCHTATSGDVVYAVTATDGDPSDTLTTTLDTVSPSTHFSLDSSTGQVTLTTSSPSITTYTLSFSVTDGCSTSSSSLTVIVSNTAPYFSNLPGTANTGCFSSVGTTVFTVIPTDDDGVTDTTTMSLSSVTPAAHFAFDTATGAVTVSSSSLNIGTYTMTFSVTDLCGQSSTDTLTITVTDNNPSFTNLDGSVSVGCYAPFATNVFTVTSADSDTASGDSVTMALNTITPAAHFNFDAVTGAVTVSSSPLTIGAYTLSVTATDTCGQSATNSLTVTVTDTVPSFTNLDGNINVGCYSPFGTNVFTVTSVDSDTASGDSVTMALNTITPAAHFNFDAVTGAVTVSSSPLTIGSYTLSVTATDTCSQSATNSLTVTVTDTVPSFTNLDGNINVGCYSPLRTSVFNVTSADSDTASGDSLTVTLDFVTPTSDFGFNPLTGEVTVSTPLLTIGTYVMTFTVADSCGQSATNTLTLIVTDSTPYFSNLDAIITSASTVTPGDVLYTVTSIDADSGSGDQLTTTLDSVTPSTHFAFNAVTGEVSASSQVSITDYVLTFTVADSCGQSSTNTLTISIYNNAPVITSLPSTVDVREDETSSLLLHTVAVSDVDGHAITCVISDTVPASAPFVMKFINNGAGLDNGIYLSPNAGLDYSVVNTYTLTINCTDGYDNDVDTLYVYIVGNGMPLISNLQNTTSISTTTVANSEVFVVLTSDLENNQLSFSLNCTNTVTCPFTVYSTGSIYLSQTLLGTTTIAYELDVTVSDSYSSSAAHRLTVFISDLNVEPVLTNLPQTIQVAEDTTPGSLLFLLSVFDADNDVNFTFDVVTTPVGGAAKFVVNDASQTVSLATTQSLDYETATEYALNISVSDGTLASPFAVLTLQVADVNEPPTLTQTHYYMSRDEGTAGTSFQSPSIQASDPDSGDVLTFSFGNGSHLDCGLLSINSTTGVMGYASDYDVDNINLSSYFSCVIKVEDTGGLAATATATLSIQDVNDNQPKFTTTKNVVVTVSKSTTAIGTSLTVVSVSDNDRTAVNRQLSFTLTQTDYYFAMTSSGEVTLAGDLSIVPAGMTLNATITVQNVGYAISDTTVVFLKVVEEDSDSFWDEGSNIAWVALTCVAALALGLAVAWLLWKHPPSCKRRQPSFRKVNPTNKTLNPRPREDFMYQRHSNLNFNTDRTLTSTDVNVAGRWDAWGAPW